MGEAFDKEMRDVDWERVFARQALRAPLLETWFELLDLKPASHVADFGCGPGYVSMALAMQVGPPPGRVYAVDRSRDAIAFLERQRRMYGMSQIETVTGDLLELETLPGPVDCALLAMTVHHADSPRHMLERAGYLTGPARPLVVAEFHPDSPCEVGPPREARLAPETLEKHAAGAGLRQLAYRRQTPEHYVTLFSV